MKCFDNVTFSGNFLNGQVFQIEWFVENYETSFVVNSTKNAQPELQQALNSGIKKVYFNNDRYFPISNTIVISGSLDIFGMKQHLDASNNWFHHEPCIYSQSVVTLVQYNYAGNNAQNQPLKPRLSIEGLNLCCCKPFSNGVSGDTTPVMIINNVGTQTLWGLYVDINIIAGNGTEIINDDFRYTGLRIFADTHAITFIELCGSLSRIYKAFDIKGNTNSYSDSSLPWITDVKIWADTACVFGGEFGAAPTVDPVYPVINYGSHQMKGVFSTSENDAAYFLADCFKNYGYIWDAGCVDPNNGKWYCQYPVKPYKTNAGFMMDRSQEQHSDASVFRPTDAFYPNLLADKSIKYSDIGVTSVTRIKAYPKSGGSPATATETTLDFLRYKFPKHLCRWDNTYYYFSHRSDVSFCFINSENDTRNFIYEETITIVRSNKTAPIQDMPPLYIAPARPEENFTITIQYFANTNDSQAAKTIVISKSNYNVYKYGDYIRVTDLFLPKRDDYYRSSKTVINYSQDITTVTQLISRPVFFVPNYHATDIVRSGNDEDLVNMSLYDKGEMFYHETYGQLWWNGSSWTERDGAIAGVKRNGTFAERPITGLYVGFQYFCTIGAKVAGSAVSNIVIYFTGSGWVDALGRLVTSV